MCHSPPGGRSVCTGWGVLGDAGTFYISISTHYQPASGAGKGFRFPASSFPFATPSHQMPLPTIQTHPHRWVKRFHIHPSEYNLTQFNKLSEAWKYCKIHPVFQSPLIFLECVDWDCMGTRLFPPKKVCWLPPVAFCPAPVF